MKCAVIGLGRYGQSLAAQLHQAGAEVIAIDANPELVDAARDQVSVAVHVDATDEAELRAQGIADVDVVVISIGTEFESAVLTTALVKKFGVKRVIARATSTLRARILKLVGADETVSPEEEAARETVQRVLRPALADYLKLTATRSVIEVVATKAFHGKTLRDLDLRKRYKVQVLAIKHRVSADTADGEEVQVIDTADAQEPIQPGDSLICVGNDLDLGRLIRDADRD